MLVIHLIDLRGKLACGGDLGRGHGLVGVGRKRMRYATAAVGDATGRAERFS